jgi:hypothetical protein
MMGLGDRVESWARRFGVPPPPGVDVEPDASAEPADQEPAEGEGRRPREEAPDERFTRDTRLPR